jgi:hypothetical protein
MAAVLYRALRGVCIGVNRHLVPGDEAELDAATAVFLKEIGAVEKVADPQPNPENVPAKAGKKEK